MRVHPLHARHLPGPPGGMRRTSPRPAAERLLDALGVDPAFADDVLGDLAEEYALRVARDGVSAARRWYVREALRSTPHLIWSAVRHVVRHGDRRARTRLATSLTAVVLAPVVVVLALSLRNGPPARLVPVTSGAGGVVVNSLYPVRLPLRVLDGAGHLLKTAGVRYRWVSGVPAAVFADGTVICTRRGDAVVRASLGPLATDVVLRCRPVHSVAASQWEMPFVLGDPERELAFTAVDADGRPVTPLTGVLRVRDTTVAALVATRDGHHVRPRAVGQTLIDAWVGDHGTDVMVTVYAPVRTLEGLRREQRLVAVPVRLESGESRRWRLAPGDYVVVSVLPAAAAGPTPKLGVLGANCITAGAQRYVCVAGPNAWVIAYHPWQAAPTPPRTGYVAIRRLGDS